MSEFRPLTVAWENLVVSVSPSGGSVSLDLAGACTCKQKVFICLQWDMKNRELYEVSVEHRGVCHALHLSCVGTVNVNHEILCLMRAVTMNSGYICDLSDNYMQIKTQGPGYVVSQWMIR